MAYPETIKYLESFINYEKIPHWPYKESLKLDRCKEFLEIIGNPQDALKCLHIAGTKGKGSTCAFITYILKEAGYKVGLYTSPHLSDFRERIRILHPNRQPLTANHDFEGMIPRRQMVTLVERLKLEIEKYNKNSKYGPLSFFEVYTALSFVYFKENNVDFLVLETGLGGRLDATNVVNPLAAAITPISYEHTQKLGTTLKKIAAEKAGIIKSKKLIVISSPQRNEAIKVIRQRCKRSGAKLFEAGKDILCRPAKNHFDIIGLFNAYPDLKIRLLGGHQLINATVAVGVIEALRFYDIVVGAGAIRRGLYNTLWPGRCEVISQKPLVVIDGAQNIASAAVLKKAVKENFSAKGAKYKRLILVLGISQDKDIAGVCKELYCLADVVILTKADNPRAAEPDTLAEYFSGKEHYITVNTAAAKRLAFRLAKRKDLVLVCGSLFTVGEFRDGKI